MKVTTTKRIINYSDTLAKVLDETNAAIYAIQSKPENVPVVIARLTELFEELSDKPATAEALKTIASDLKSISNSKAMHIEETEKLYRPS